MKRSFNDISDDTMCADGQKPRRIYTVNYHNCIICHTKVHASQKNL